MKITPFQAVVLAVFAVAIVAAVVVLAITKSSSHGSGMPVVIWGSIPQRSFSSALAQLTQGSNGLKINYVEKRADTFDQDIVEALASGTGPDAVLLPQDLIGRYRDKVLPLSFATMPLPTFKTTFVQEGELFLDQNGILALPFSLDPLVMYWNRDMLSNAGIARPPQSWDEFITLVPKLTTVDRNFNILKSGVALGEYRNITNAKDIIAALLLQTGNPITTLTSQGIAVSLVASLSSIGAINFYTDFSNPVKPDYSWNRALPNSLDMFTAGDLAFYFGFVSEISNIRDKNPNLNFDVTYFPEPKGAPVAITLGKMQGLAVLKNSRNSKDAFEAILAISGSGPLGLFAQSTGLPPVRRDMLSINPADPYQSIFYNSAIRARGWLDPNPAASGNVFRDMIESITGGALEAGRAIGAAAADLNNSLR